MLIGHRIWKLRLKDDIEALHFKHRIWNVSFQASHMKRRISNIAYETSHFKHRIWNVAFEMLIKHFMWNVLLKCYWNIAFESSPLKSLISTFLGNVAATPKVACRPPLFYLCRRRKTSGKDETFDQRKLRGLHDHLLDWRSQ